MRKFSPIFTLSLSATLLMIGVGMVVALLPQRIHAMGGTLESVGMVASTFAVAYLLAQLVIGALSDQLGARRFLVAGYLLCSCSGLIYNAAGSPASIYLGRVIQGLGEAPIWALGPAILSLAYPQAKGRAIGLYNAAIHAGLTFGPLLGLLIAPTGSGGLPFLVFAALCLSGGAVNQLLLPDTRVKTGAPKISGRALLSVLGRKRPAVILCGILLYGAAYGVFVSVLPISLVGLKSFSAAQISIGFVIFYAAISVSQIAAGAISDRIGRQGFMVSGLAIAAIGIAVFPLFDGLWVYIPLGFASAGLGIFCVTSIAELNDSVSDGLKGAVSGSYYFFWGAGYALGPILIGAAVSRAPCTGYTTLASALAFLALLLWRVRT